MPMVRSMVECVCACIWLNKTSWWFWRLVSDVINQGARAYPWSPKKTNHYDSKKPLLWKIVIIKIYVPTSHVSPTAPCARCMPTELFCEMKESRAPPKKWVTTFSRWFWESQMSRTFKEWYCLRLRYGNGSGEGALMRTCVQSIAPMVSGRPATAWNPLLTATCFSSVYGNFSTVRLVDLFHPRLVGEHGWWTAVICPPCLPAPAEIFHWPKSPRWRVPAHVVLQG